MNKKNLSSHNNISYLNLYKLDYNLNISTFIFSIIFFSIFYTLYFFPALSKAMVLAPGDGFVFYLPAFSIDWKLWEANILAGYPVFADPQFFLWYPPRWVFRDFNLFVIFAYVAASSFTFLFVYSKLESIAAGLVAGIIYGSGSFMVGHLGHTSIIHAGAWLPLIAWSIDALADRRTAIRFVIGALAVALCLLSGHPQIFVYAMILAGSMALRNLWITWHKDRSTTIRLAAIYATMTVLGVLVCAVLLIPFWELRELSARSETWSYSDFISYSLPLRQLSMLFFPYLYGGWTEGTVAYFGQWGPTEITIYAGIGAIFMAVFAVFARKAGDGSLFWLWVTVTAIVFATCGYNYLGHLFYQIPVINSFRASARIAMVYTFAIAVLAGIATAHLQRDKIRIRDIALAGIIVVTLAIITGMISVLSDRWQEKVYDSAHASSVIQTIILLPILSFGVVVFLFFVARSLRFKSLLSYLIIAAVAVDVGLFGWLYEWRHSPTKPDEVAYSASIQDDLMASKGRLLTMPDAFSRNAFQPNINLLYGISSISGYGPLEPKAFQDATGIISNGNIDDFPNPGLRRLLGISHIIFSPYTPTKLLFGSCSTETTADPIELELPVAVHATEIRVISNMACSTHRAGNDPVLTFNIISDKNRTSEEVALLAGRDTSEWAHDRSDVRDIVRHARAPIASSFDAGGFNGHLYIASLPLGTDVPIEVKRLVLHFVGRESGVLDIQKLELVNSKTGVIYPLTNLIKLGNDASISKIDDTLSVASFPDSEINLAWLVNEVQSVPIDEAAQIVRSGTFSNGQPFEPERVALIEGEAPELTAPAAGQNSAISVLAESDTRLSLQVDAPVQSFLFLSRSYHPGWEAHINGKKVPLYRTNAAFQGVVVPQGRSEVVFKLNSRTLNIGGFVSLVSLSILGGILFWPIARRLLRQLNIANRRS